MSFDDAKETVATIDCGRDLIAEVEFAAAYSFKYSPRPGTPAAAMENQIPDEVKTERLARLQELIGEQSQAFNRAKVGQVLPVLFERAGRHPGQLVGRSPWLQGVHADGPESLVGSVADVAIESTRPNSLSGHLVDSRARRAIYAEAKTAGRKTTMERPSA